MSQPPKLLPCRRSFCIAAGAGVGAGLLLVSLPGCDPGTGERIGEGSLDNTGGGTGGSGAAGGGGGGGGGHAGGGGGGGGGSAGGGGGGGGGGTSGSDMGTQQGDMATVSNCTPKGTAAGTASSYTVGAAPKKFGSGSNIFYVARDAGGLYAVSPVCPHAGCDCTLQSTQFYCPCHGATFALDGSKPTSPAHTNLDHFAMCVDAQGNVTVDTNTTVSISTRY